MISFFLPLLFFGAVLTGSPEADQTTNPEGSLNVEPSQAQASEEVKEGIGTVAEVQGEARAFSKSSSEGRLLAQGDAVYAEETISTGPGSSIQIEFVDESLFSMVENSSVQLDEFVYDENAQDGIFSAYVAKGIFRFITGKIANAKPENVEINVPSGTIGIRGTIVIGEIEGERCLVSLEAEEGKETVPHRVIVASRVGGKFRKVEIKKPGFATVIEAKGQRPKPAFRLPEGVRQRLHQNLPRPRFLPRGPDGRPQRHSNVMDPRRPRARREGDPGGARTPEGVRGRGERQERPGPDRARNRTGNPHGLNRPSKPGDERRPPGRRDEMNRRQEANSERPQGKKEKKR